MPNVDLHATPLPGRGYNTSILALYSVFFDSTLVSLVFFARNDIHHCAPSQRIKKFQPESRPAYFIHAATLEATMADTPVQDSRQFFVLPQGYEGGGYYAYGTPGEGRSQYAHPALISVINQIAFLWSGYDARKFGVGNISLADGVRHPDHRTHRSGLEVDIRPLRKNEKGINCTIHDDRVGTEKLIKLFMVSPNIKHVVFNDLSIHGVRRAKNHDNHFHVALKRKDSDDFPASSAVSTAAMHFHTLNGR